MDCRHSAYYCCRMVYTGVFKEQDLYHAAVFATALQPDGEPDHGHFLVVPVRVCKPYVHLVPRCRCNQQPDRRNREPVSPDRSLVIGLCDRDYTRRYEGDWL